MEKQKISRAAGAEKKLPVVGSRLAQTSRFDPFCVQPPISLDRAKREKKGVGNITSGKAIYGGLGEPSSWEYVDENETSIGSVFAERISIIRISGNREARNEKRWRELNRAKSSPDQLGRSSFSLPATRIKRQPTGIYSAPRCKRAR